MWHGRRTFRIIAVILLVLGALVGGMCIPAGHRSHFMCLRCGLHEHRTRWLAWNFQSQEPRLLHEWYARRVGLGHDHAWVSTGNSQGLGLWGNTNYLACGGGESLTRGGLADWVAKVLIRLESSGRDLILYQHLQHPDLEHREAAVRAACECDPRGNDSEIDAWWEKVLPLLQMEPKTSSKNALSEVR